MNGTPQHRCRRHLMRRLCEFTLLLTPLLSLCLCPYSKVEESFNLQASHDLFYFGIGPAWKSFSWHDAVTESCESTAGGRREAKSCASRKGGEDLPYDHLRFPGVVPRTFMGAFILSSIAKIISFIIPKQIFDLPSHPMIVQFLIRLELMLFSWIAHLRLTRSIERYFQRRCDQRVHPISTSSAIQLQPPPMISNYYLLITASQFHLPFYSSRLLPNTFALILSTHAFADWFNDRPHRTAAFLVISTVVFRCDTILLLFTVGLMMLIQRQLTIMEAICTGVLSGFLSLLLTIPLDSLLWGRPIWPEFEVLWFNTVDNRSSEWGTMPYHWYFTSALPRGMLLTALLVPLAFSRVPELMMILWAESHLKKSKMRILMEALHFSTMFDLCLMPLFAAVLGFVLLYSFLPHKEIRFIFPAMPIFNVCAAYGMSRLHRLALPCVSGEKAKMKSIPDGNKLMVARGMYLCGLVLIASTMLGCLFFIRLSKENYPGGVALSRLRQYLDVSIPLLSSIPQSQTPTLLPNKELQSTDWETVHVHIDVAAAMTGVSLFGQRHASHRSGKRGELWEGPFKVEKSGYEDMNNMRDSSMVFTHILTEHQHVKGYHVVDTILGHPRFDFNTFRIEMEESIYIMERDGLKYSIQLNP